MIRGLELLYDAARWTLKPDSMNPAFLVNDSFGGSMEFRAAEALYKAVYDHAAADKIAKMPGGGVYTFVESGTCDGFSTAFIAEALLSVMSQVTRVIPGASHSPWTPHVITCDIFPTRDNDPTTPFKWPSIWEELGIHEIITPVIADSREPATWRDGIDACLIDSEHTYPTVKAEWDAIGPHLRSGGLAFFHDVHLFDGVRDAVREIAHDLKADVQHLDSCRGLAMIVKP